MEAQRGQRHRGIGPPAAGAKLGECNERFGNTKVSVAPREALDASEELVSPRARPATYLHLRAGWRA